MMDCSNNANLEPETKKKTKRDDFRSDDTQDDLAGEPELGVDELNLIFGNYWISTGDLLTFRLVNQSWCQAATTTLLQRDNCCISLEMDCTKQDSCFYKGWARNKNEKKLSQLTQLMSNSQKFPATALSIQTSNNSLTDYTQYPDLVLFFKLHGHKIKTLSPKGLITQKCLLDFCLINSPSLEILDLCHTKLPSSDKEADKTSDLKWMSKVFRFKTLRVRDWCEFNYDPDTDTREESRSDRKLIRLLLSSSSKLSCIEDVSLGTLGSVLEEGKGHLIRSFRCLVLDTFHTFKPNLVKFVELNPKLSRVNLDLGMERKNIEPNIDVPLLNAFIKSFKDTIQEFMLDFTLNRVISGPLLKIPPMRCLKSISLACSDGWNQHVGQNTINLRARLFEFEMDISAENYFPNLKEVTLHSVEPHHVHSSLMSFFAFKSAGNKDGKSVWGSLPKVETLKIVDADGSIRSNRDASQQPPQMKVPLFSEMFPNIRNLKIETDDANKLASSWWGISPNVEYIEIDGIDSSSHDDVEPSFLVDKFFTGFSLDMCKKMRTTQLPQEILNNPELINYLRVTPSVCDLRYLKELKVSFPDKLWGEFASHVTGAYAFSKMPSTKFIISYSPDVLAWYKDRDKRARREQLKHYVGKFLGLLGDDENQNKDDKNGDENNKNGVKNVDDRNNCEENGDEEIKKYEELCFGSIKPYVHIVYENLRS